MIFLISAINVGWVVAISFCVLIAILIVALISFIITTYNTLIRMRNNCDEAWTSIQVKLKMRHEFISDIVQKLKPYIASEILFSEVGLAINNATNAITIEDIVAKENHLDNCIKNLQLSNDYQKLKQDDNFLQIKNKLCLLETELAKNSNYYNGICRGYNTKIQIFPANILGLIMKLKKRQYFELEYFLKS